MATNPEKKENLLRDATAFPQRGELKLLPRNEVVFIGFRADGAASWFFGEDPVYQYDNDFRLRRVFFRGERFGAHRGKLVLYCKQQQPRVRLQKEDVSSQTTAEIIRVWNQWQQTVQDAINNNSYRWNGCSISVDEFQQRVLDWLQAIPSGIKIADTLRRPKANR